jgi:hypothetical protein
MNGKQAAQVVGVKPSALYDAFRRWETRDMDGGEALDIGSFTVIRYTPHEEGRVRPVYRVVSKNGKDVPLVGVHPMLSSWLDQIKVIESASEALESIEAQSKSIDNLFDQDAQDILLHERKAELDKMRRGILKLGELTFAMRDTFRIHLEEDEPEGNFLPHLFSEVG